MSRGKGSSIGWLVVEAGVSLTAGAAMGSVALLAFGADSAIEIASAAVLLRRRAVERRGGAPTRVAELERRAAWATGVLLLLLAACVVVDAGSALLRHSRPGACAVGLVMAAASTVVMPWLVRWKRRVVARIGSAALKTDAACGMVCVYMAATVLVGLALNAVFGWWWADPAAALAMVYFIVREGWDATLAARGRGQGGCCGS